MIDDIKDDIDDEIEKCPKCNSTSTTELLSVHPTKMRCDDCGHTDVKKIFLKE